MNSTIVLHIGVLRYIVSLSCLFVFVCNCHKVVCIFIVLFSLWSLCYSVSDFSVVHAVLVCLSTGFGSMLRSIGAQIEKTTNREACRDLSGRRMRDINNEKKYVGSSSAILCQ